ncbi:MAG TPA: glycosyltransferase, partial [Thermoanaerobaculia bacterium]
MTREPDGGAYVIAAGGTGGHIFPAIALAREIRSRRPEAEIVFIGSRHGLETKLVPQAGFPLELVRASGFAGKSAGAMLGALAEVPVGFMEARRILAERRARAVAGVGGYVSVPVVLAARSLRVPTLIHESNAFPGVANRLLNRFATRTAVGVAAANSRLARPGVVTGTPVRPEFFRVPPMDPGSATRRLLVFG